MEQKTNEITTELIIGIPAILTEQGAVA